VLGPHFTYGIIPELVLSFYNVLSFFQLYGCELEHETSINPTLAGKPFLERYTVARYFFRTIF